MNTIIPVFTGWILWLLGKQGTISTAVRPLLCHFCMASDFSESLPSALSIFICLETFRIHVDHFSSPSHPLASTLSSSSLLLIIVCLPCIFTALLVVFQIINTLQSFLSFFPAFFSFHFHLFYHPFFPFTFIFFKRECSVCSVFFYTHSLTPFPVLFLSSILYCKSPF